MNIRCRSNELDEHIKKHFDRLGILPEQFDSEIMELTVVPGGMTESEAGLHYANFRYRYVMYIERLPKAQLALLALLIQNYLDRCDDVRDRFDLPDVKLDVISLDRGVTVDVDATVEFVDPAYLVQVDGGPILFNGAEYDAGEYDLRVAETLDSVDGEIGDTD